MMGAFSCFAALKMRCVCACVFPVGELLSAKDIFIVSVYRHSHFTLSDCLHVVSLHVVR